MPPRDYPIYTIPALSSLDLTVKFADLRDDFGGSGLVKPGIKREYI
jgi:hypothetical protein